MSNPGDDGSEQIRTASGSGEIDDQGPVVMLDRDMFGTGWDNVEQITQCVTSDVRALAAQSGEPDKFLQIMEGLVKHIIQTPEHGSAPLCCSLVLHCAEEFERTQRPRIALRLYRMALGIAEKNLGMMDWTERATTGCEKLIAAGIRRGIDAGFPTWDMLPEKFIHGPYYRSVCDEAGELVGYQTCWEFEMKEGRGNIPEISFNCCDFMRILFGGNRWKCLQGIMNEFTNHMEETPCMRGTPLRCSFLFLCAHGLILWWTKQDGRSWQILLHKDGGLARTLAEALRIALLWSERSKGRLLMKRLKQPVISMAHCASESANDIADTSAAHMKSSDDADHLQSAESDAAITNWEMTTLEREFHNNDDWAMDFIFRGDKFPNHGSKMVFVEFTMVSKNKLATFIMNDTTGTIQGFLRSNLSRAIDERARKLAEEEMELLTKDLHDYQVSKTGY